MPLDHRLSRRSTSGAVSGSGAALGFLGASNNGTGSGTGTIVYTDGTTQTFALGFADWWSAAAIGGTSIAATTPYLNNGSNSSRQHQAVHVYYASVTLSSSKTVAYVVLPDVTENGPGIPGIPGIPVPRSWENTVSGITV